MALLNNNVEALLNTWVSTMGREESVSHTSQGQVLLKKSMSSSNMTWRTNTTKEDSYKKEKNSP